MKVLTNREMSFIEQELMLLAKFNSHLDPSIPEDLELFDLNIARLEQLEYILDKSLKELHRPKLV